MTGIALLVFTGFILYVMVWSIKNDGARSIKDQTGLIKMRESSEDTQSGRHQFEANLSSNSSIQPKTTEQDRRRS